MENLGIDLKLLIAQLVNFILFFILFQKFLSKPFLKFIREERKKEEDKHHALAIIKKQEDTIATMEQEARRKVKKQIDEMLSKAKEDGQKTREEIVAQAKKEAAQIMERAHAEVEEERRALHKEIKTKTVDLGMLVVTNALREYLPEDVQKRVTQHILSNVSKEVN